MPREKPSQDTKLVFGKQMADHMLVAEWTLQNGWDIPSIVPFGPLAIPPSASVLHYGIEVCYSLNPHVYHVCFSKMWYCLLMYHV